jgi:hypothetical protein
MTRIVFVHGMKNEGQDKDKLRDRWHDALREGWRNAGVPAPQGYTVDLPYYGDVLHGLTTGAPQGAGVRRRGPEDVSADVGDFEQDYSKALKEKLDISNEEVAAELPPVVRERGPANWEWVQAIARAVEKRSPRIAEMALKGVPQVDGYLNRRDARRAVDNVVRPSLNQGRTIVVAHSLGTIVTYLLLKELSGRLDVPLYMTLGSPLGIEAVVRRMKPISLPQTIGAWINGVDERDYVALVSKLLAPTYPNVIKNIADLKNGGDDPHSISEYLKQRPIAEAIARAL